MTLEEIGALDRCLRVLDATVRAIAAAGLTKAQADALSAHLDTDAKRAEIEAALETLFPESIFPGTRADVLLLLGWLIREKAKYPAAPKLVDEPAAPIVPTVVLGPMDEVDIAGVKPWGDDRIVSALRSVTVRGDTIHLDFDKPPFPDRNEHISITWVAIKIENGRGVRMGRFEHGRPSNDTRAADTLIGDRPGFTVNRFDDIAVMGIAYNDSGRPRIRTNNVRVKWA